MMSQLTTLPQSLPAARYEEEADGPRDRGAGERVRPFDLHHPVPAAPAHPSARRSRRSARSAPRAELPLTGCGRRLPARLPRYMVNPEFPRAPAAQSGVLSAR